MADGQRRPGLDRDARGQGAQIGVESHGLPAAARPLEQRAPGHIAAGHLLQADRLGTELHLIGAMSLGASALVFHGERPRAVHLGDIGDAMHPQPIGGNMHRAQNAHPLPTFGQAVIGPFVQHAPLRGQAVVLRQPLDMDQRALARA